jgi:hypothetical protein
MSGISHGVTRYTCKNMRNKHTIRPRTATALRHTKRSSPGFGRCRAGAPGPSPGDAGRDRNREPFPSQGKLSGPTTLASPRVRPGHSASVREPGEPLGLRGRCYRGFGWPQARAPPADHGQRWAGSEPGAFPRKASSKDPPPLHHPITARAGRRRPENRGNSCTPSWPLPRALVQASPESTLGDIEITCRGDMHPTAGAKAK